MKELIHSNLQEIYDFYKKFPEFCGKILVETRHGFFPVLACEITAYNSEVIEISTEFNNIQGSPDHHLFINDEWKKIKDIKIKDKLLTRNGYFDIINTKKISKKMDLLDIEVETVNEFYANGVVSHNSSILEALSFVFFGKSFRKINKPQLVNTINKKEMLVECEFSSGGTDYKIERGIKPNIFNIFKNNDLIEIPADIKNYQDILEDNIIKMSYKTFCQVIVLGSASFIPFMQLTTSNRREVVEDLLSLNIFTIMNSFLKEDFTYNKKLIMDSEYKLKDIKNRIETHKKYVDDIKKNIENENFDYQSLIDDKEKEINDIQKEYEKKKENKLKIEDKINEFDIDKIKNNKDKSLSIKGSLKTLIKSSKEKINFLENNETCPTCEQVIDNNWKDIIITNEGKNIKNNELKLLKIDDFNVKTDKKLDKYEEFINYYKKYENSIFKIENNIKMINEQVDEYKIKVNKNTQGNDFIDPKILKDLILDLSDEKEIYLKLKKVNDTYKQAATLLKDTGFKSEIIKQYIPLMNILINKYLGEMEFFCEFTIDENFNEIIKSRYRDEFSYMSFSEGEKTRIDLAILFTWREIAKKRNSASINILIFDEIFDSSLDDDGIINFIKILNSIDKGSNVVVISHSTDVLEDHFTRVLKVEKVNNFSNISVRK